MSAQFFCLSFAGDTGDTGDMKNLKIYTIIQVKPKYADLLTRWFDSKGGPLFLDFFAGDAGDTDDIRKMNECKFFFIYFAGDAGDTGDMKSLKIYTNIQVKPKSAGLLTRQFYSKGVPLFLYFFAGDTDDIRKMNECPIFLSVFCR